jgi:hypothetical protein
LLNDNLIQTQLAGSAFNHLLLDAVLGDEAKNKDLLLLPDAMSTVC